MTQHYDCLIVGGGIFGSYASLWLSRQGQRVALVEKDPELLSRASLVNQARLHAGYHYPRSVATARMADDHKDRFTSDHRAFINDRFVHLYAVDRYASMTHAAGFERFCRHIGIPAKRLSRHQRIDTRRLEAIYETTEHSFDPIGLQSYYTQLLEENPQVEVMTHTELLRAEPDGDGWKAEVQPLGTPSGRTWVRAQTAINATYASLNAVNEAFGAPPLELCYELCEIALLPSGDLEGFALTVMDGHFCSLMPFGNSGLHSLSSVTYTPRRFSFGRHPEFSCQSHRLDCTETQLANCNSCPERPETARPRMIRQLNQYLSEDLEPEKHKSWFTVKTKLKASSVDDSRPTAIHKALSSPDLYCLFSGKINSIYEVESAYELQ